jgi:DNA-binding beta-propeller fold protein YncE
MPATNDNTQVGRRQVLTAPFAVAGFAVAISVVACDNGTTEREIVFSLSEEETWLRPPAPPDPGHGRILLTNAYDDTVSVVDLGSLGEGELVEIDRIPVGLIPVEREGPHHVAPLPDGSYYFVGISNNEPRSGSGPHGAHGNGTVDGRLLKVRSSDHVTVASIRVDRNVGDVRVTPDGKRALVSHFDLYELQTAIDPNADLRSRVVIVDTDTMERVAAIDTCPGAHSLAIAPDGGRAYVSCVDDHLALLELDDFSVTLVPVIESPGTALAPRCYPYGLTMTPSGDAVWVSCFLSKEFVRYDVESATMGPSSDVFLAGGGLFGGTTADGSELAVAHQEFDGVTLVDAAAHEVIATHLVPPAMCVKPHAVVYDDSETRLLVVCEGDHVNPGSLAVLDRVTGAVLQHLAVGTYPDDIAIIRPAAGPP